MVMGERGGGLIPTFVGGPHVGCGEKGGLVSVEVKGGLQIARFFCRLFG